MESEAIKKYDLRPIWDAILEVYKVFAAICERHGLRYCADCGTALGAIRHGGFIPWDDDMDIQMPRTDYEKFVEIAQSELPKGYAWIDRFNCKSHTLPFGKVVMTDNAKIAAVAKAAGIPRDEGIFVDVFPLDGFPDSWLGRIWRRIQNALVAFSIDSHHGLGHCKTLKSKIGYFLGLAMRPFNYNIKNARDVADFYDKRAKRFPFGATELCVSIGAARHDDDKPYPTRFFGARRMIPFDEIEMPVQENADGYLTWIFGDYMTLPPPEKRIPEHSGAIKEHSILNVNR